MWRLDLLGSNTPNPTSAIAIARFRPSKEHTTTHLQHLFTTSTSVKHLNVTSEQSHPCHILRLLLTRRQSHTFSKGLRSFLPTSEIGCETPKHLYNYWNIFRTSPKSATYASDTSEPQVHNESRGKGIGSKQQQL